jgi:hypothetical protein
MNLLLVVESAFAKGEADFCHDWSMQNGGLTQPSTTATALAAHQVTGEGGLVLDLAAR